MQVSAVVGWRWVGQTDRGGGKGGCGRREASNVGQWGHVQCNRVKGTCCWRTLSW